MKNSMVIGFLSACLFSSIAIANPSEVSESLFGLSPGPQGLSFQVYSGGCTDKEDFQVRILESFPMQLELIRINPDYCRAYIPYGVDITYSWEDLGLRAGDKFTVINPLRITTIVNR